MQYNNKKFGEAKEALIDSPYFEHFQESRPSPPVVEYYLIDDGGDHLIDDSGDFFVTGSA